VTSLIMMDLKKKNKSSKNKNKFPFISMSSLSLLLLFLTYAFSQYTPSELALGKGLTNHYSNKNDMDSLREVIGILEANKKPQKEEPLGTPVNNDHMDINHGLVHALHAAMHYNKQQRTDGGI